MTLPWLTRKKPANAAELLHFTLPDAYAGQTVYNISVPFIDQERHVLWGRTEPLDSEHSDVLLFDLVTRSYVAGAPRLLQAQDAQYLGQFPDAAGRRWHVMVAVLVDIDADGRIRSYRDAFYRWQHSVHELSTGSEPQPFAHGPVGQKDTRLVLLRDSQGGPAGIGVCIRPQGVYGGRGQIGYLEIHHLDELEATLTRTFAQADPALLIPHVFRPALRGGELEDWGGPNQLIQDTRDADRLHIIGHYATFRRDTGGLQTAQREYMGMHAVFSRSNRRLIAAPTVLITASELPAMTPKVPATMGGVVFLSGLERINDRECFLYGGIGDVAAWRKRILNPVTVRRGVSLQRIAALQPQLS